MSFSSRVWRALCCQGEERQTDSYSKTNEIQQEPVQNEILDEILDEIELEENRRKKFENVEYETEFVGDISEYRNLYSDVDSIGEYYEEDEDEFDEEGSIKSTDTYTIEVHPTYNQRSLEERIVTAPGSDLPPDIMRQRANSRLRFQNLIESDAFKEKIERVRADLNKIYNVPVKNHLSSKFRNLEKELRTCSIAGAEISRRINSTNISYQQLIEDCRYTEKLRKTFSLLVLDLDIIEVSEKLIENYQIAAKVLEDLPPSMRNIQPLSHLLVHQKDYLGALREMNEKLDSLQMLNTAVVADANRLSTSLSLTNTAERNTLKKIRDMVKHVESQTQKCRKHRRVKDDSFDLIRVKEAIIEILNAIANCYEVRTDLRNIEKSIQESETIIRSLSTASRVRRPENEAKIYDEYIRQRDKRDKQFFHIYET